MAVFGLWVIGVAGWHAWHGTLPARLHHGRVSGIAALLANAASFGLLWAYRGGDANMRSAWICTRNDVLGNLAVLLAALGVFGTGTGWPDVIVAVIMAGLALQGRVRGAQPVASGVALAYAGSSRVRMPSTRCRPHRRDGAGLRPGGRPRPLRAVLTIMPKRSAGPA